MHFWICPIFVFITQYAAAQSNDNDNDTSSPDLTMFQNDFSPTAFASLLNDSSGYPEYTVQSPAGRSETRKQITKWWEDTFGPKHYGTAKDYLQVCYYLQTTYRNALTDLRRYFDRRVLYKNTLEYELGFLAHEIIWRYQTILEIYHFISIKYLKYKFRNFAPPSLMFYFYSNVVQHGVMIVHLCNMMHELERKYRGPAEKGVFDDYDFSGRGRQKGGQKPQNDSFFADQQAQLDQYIKDRLREQKKKQKERKRVQKQYVAIGKTTTRGKATPRKSKKWPLEYGWSIEDKL